MAELQLSPRQARLLIYHAVLSLGKATALSFGEENMAHFQNRQLPLWAVVVVLLLSSCLGLSADDQQDWKQFNTERTLELLTLNPAGEEHWSTFWLVVL